MSARKDPEEKESPEKPKEPQAPVDANPEATEPDPNRANRD